MHHLDGLITSDVDSRLVLLHEPCMADRWECHSVHAPFDLDHSQPSPHVKRNGISPRQREQASCGSMTED